MTTILALIRDLMFTSKIEEVARALGVEAKFTSSPKDLVNMVKADRPFLVALDLDDSQLNPLYAARALRSDVVGKPIVLGFYSHVDDRLATEARGAGCDHVVPRSGFVKKLAELVGRTA